MEVFAVVPMLCYNGERGRGPKRFFYVFYPALCLHLIRPVLGGVSPPGRGLTGRGRVLEQVRRDRGDRKMGFQIAGILILLLFYGCYFAKMAAQRRRGIRTDQMGRGKTGLARYIEWSLKL